MIPNVLGKVLRRTKFKIFQEKKTANKEFYNIQKPYNLKIILSGEKALSYVQEQTRVVMKLKRTLIQFGYEVVEFVKDFMQ